MSDDPRKNLAAFQETLARVLTGQESAPMGFDAARVSLAADRLLAKRRSNVSHLIPNIASSLGDDFVRAFSIYTSNRSSPPEGALRDAVDFALTLDPRLLSDAAREEWLFLRLRTIARVGLAARRDGSALIGARLPGWGIRVLRIPWPSAANHKVE